MFFFFSFSRVYGVPLLFSFFTDLSVERCLSFSSVPGSEFISEQKIAPKILRKNKVLWRRYSACLGRFCEGACRTWPGYLLCGCI